MREREREGGLVKERGDRERGGRQREREQRQTKEREREKSIIKKV